MYPQPSQGEPDISLRPTDRIAGYDVRPGLFYSYGASVVPGGVNFTVQSRGATSIELLLFARGADEPYSILRFPPSYKIGQVYSMIIFGLDIETFEYAYRVDGPWDEKAGLRFDKTKYLLDPYARAVTGQSRWGCTQPNANHYRGRVVFHNFDWGAFHQPHRQMRDLVIYEMHVRGFTQHASAHVENPGTFAGLMEKIPYLRDLGVNAIELMPIFEFDEMRDYREVGGQRLLDYWGYNPVSFFAPNTSYSAAIEYNREGTELKKLIRALKRSGMEVILDVVFNHTAEGNADGPFISFKGFDNNIYYLLTPDGQYCNYSGCGNTLNCNHPVVRRMILDCLRYWVINYRVDGFRFDLASILGRDEAGTPMENPPLLESLAFDPVLANVKLIAEAWDAGGLYQVGSFPAWNRWAEWNGRYRDDLRAFLKGDGGYARVALDRIMGSPDLYAPDARGANASVNFITCHDGFTLHDLYAYNNKHNEKNGWNNTDGTDDNCSWNCGVEGETDEATVLELRERLCKNAMAVLLCSRGTPMLRAGDEFGSTQQGNNNAYCQDNEISWLDWSLLEKNKDLYAFVRHMIAFRGAHPAVRGGIAPARCGWPEMQAYGRQRNEHCITWDTRTVSVVFAGQRENGTDDLVCLCVNAFWESVSVELPELPETMRWRICIDTGRHPAFYEGIERPYADHASWNMSARSVIIATASPMKNAT